MSNKANIEINKRFDNNVCIISLKGSLNAYSAPIFEEELKNCISNSPRIVLDLQQLEYISSIGLGVIIGYLEEVREKKGDIKIYIKNNPIIKEIFEITGFPKIMNFFENIESAVKSFNI